MNAPNRLDNIVVVLCRPQKLVNIAGAIRAMKNMGLLRLRLVRPAEFDPSDIEGIAHRSADVLAATTLHASLDDALADAAYVAGTTSRTREPAFPYMTPRQAAAELLMRAAQGPVALLFGSEDNGLTANELDRCHCVLRIPTDPRYRSLDPSDLPSTECLKDTVARFLPLWHDEIAPAIRRGERVLIAAHGNSLRALVKYLDGISDADIVELNIPTGIPLVYELDASLKPIKSYYLGDPDAAKKAAERVAAQAAAKPQSR